MSPKPTFRIGELAARSGRSVHTIRWYDARGLIPGVTRDKGGRRVFTSRHVEWLGLLERLRTTGMSIAEMREYAVLVQQGSGSVDRQREILVAHRERIVATMNGWRSALQLIDAKLDYYAQWLATGERPAGDSETRKKVGVAYAAAVKTAGLGRGKAVSGANGAKRRLHR